jgi:heavy metal sensor kinase
MLRSFKLKLALFAGGTSGVIFAAFALLFMSMVHRVGLERIDRHLLAVTEAQLRRPPPREQWQRFDAALAGMYGDARPRPFLIQVFDRNRQPLYASANWPQALTPQALGLDEFLQQPLRPPAGPPEPPFRRLRPDGRGPDPFLARPALRRPRLATVRSDRHAWRLALAGTDALTLAVGADLADFHAELRRHWSTFAVAGPLALLLLATAGWLLAGQALRPVRTLTHVASGITARGLDRRVQTPGADQEFQALTEVINGMLDRLEASFRQAARFSADAAHELKTPLTILQGQLEQALQRPGVSPQEQRTCAGLLEEVQRLKSIVRKLLLLSQSDAGQLRLTPEPVCLTDEVGALLEDLPLLAPGLALRRSLAPGVRALADPDLLRQILQNLLSNAVKYNREGGEIDVALKLEGHLAVLTFANTVAPEAELDRARLFDRFYRGDRARNRSVDGTGLGLSLAREIARAHSGDLALAPAEPGWIAFRLTLPASAPA